MKNWGMTVGLVLGMAGMVGGCSSDCEDEIAAGERFLSAPASLACDSDQDCVVVSTGCHTFEGGICSQSYLSRSAANSAEWSNIKADLDECEEDCAVCDAALGPPSCKEGTCMSK